MLEIGLQLLQAGEAEGKGVEEGEEDGLWRNVGIVTGVGETRDLIPKVEGLIEVSGEAKKRVRFLLHSYGCKNNVTANSAICQEARATA